MTRRTHDRNSFRVASADVVVPARRRASMNTCRPPQSLTYACASAISVGFERSPADRGGKRARQGPAQDM